MVIGADAYVRNPHDGTRIRFQDDGGAGIPLVVLGGFLDPIEVVRHAPIVKALPEGVFRPIWIDHRGHGASDAPHRPEAYAIDLRAADVVAVIDELELARVAILGISWGARLGFGVVDRAPDRVRAFVAIGQHPYVLRDEGPLGRIVSEALEATSRRGMVAIVEAFENLAGRYPDGVRAAYLAEDAAAMRAAWSAALSEGPVATRLPTWNLPCCICIAARDEDFQDDARRAAAEIPGARFIVIDDTDHLGMDTADAAPFRDVVVDTLRRGGT